MRSMAFAALVFALAACNRGDDGGQLASSTSELNAAQIDAALGPADQPIDDASVPPELNNAPSNAAVSNEAAPSVEGEQ